MGAAATPTAAQLRDNVAHRHRHTRVVYKNKGAGDQLVTGTFGNKPLRFSLRFSSTIAPFRRTVINRLSLTRSYISYSLYPRYIHSQRYYV